MKTSEILKQARGYIDRYGFICSAVERLHGPAADIARVLKMIADRLGDSYTLNSWLADNHNITSDSIESDAYNKKMYQTRLAWVDSMIAEFAAKGD